jgi:cyclopropane fatty-acyl-phospholipid synthase-like methyltransferase
MIQYLLMILMMISFLIIFAPPTPPVRPVRNEIVPYSEEYVPLYKMVTYNQERYDRELQHVQQSMSASSHVLDVGSGLGYHVNYLNEHGISAVGIDSSKAMVRHSKTYAHPCMHGNVMHTSLFPEHSFTHVLCLYYTFFCLSEKGTFFHNVHHWLVEDGLLFIHGSSTFQYGEPMVGEITYESSLHNTMYKEKITYQQTYTVHHIVHVLSKPEVVQLAQQCHFKLIQDHSYGKHYLLTFQRLTYDNI